MLEQLIPVAMFILGAALASFATLQATKAGSNLATKAYLGAFPSEIPAPINTNSTPENAQPEIDNTDKPEGIMSASDMDRLEPTPQEEHDLTYIDSLLEDETPDNWKEVK